MSRRQHVVRTDDQGGVGAARSLAGCRVLCATQDCGDIFQGTQTLIAAIAVTSNHTYQRCFVSATIGHITASIPDPPPPPGPGVWSVRFEMNNPTGAPYYSEPYSSFPSSTTISSIRWNGCPPYATAGQLEGIEKDNGVYWETWLNFVNTGMESGIENPDPALQLNSKIRMSTSEHATAPFSIELTLNAPEAAGTENVVITDG